MELPQGTVTFLFTDIEGSTSLLQRLGQEYGDLLEQHNQILRAAITANNGVEVSTEGDSFFAVFTTPREALAAAASAQQALNGASWPGQNRVRVRMGIHTGVGKVSGSGGYVGLDVHRAARIGAAANGGQILISGITRDLIDARLPEISRLVDLGNHHLKDIEAPEHLFRVVASGVPDIDSPPRSRRLRSLPTSPTRFIGRNREAADVVALLAETRLVTLLGPGGAGKTRLALKVAGDLADDFADGVWFVPLDSVADPALVAPAIGDVLGIRERASTAPLELLETFLEGKSLLLVLDNLEHLRAAATVFDFLLKVGPGLRILITSRAPLGLYGEQLFAVPPLDLPPEATESDPEEISRSGAVALFVDRARITDPHFELNHATAAMVAEICRRLDGLPLAIELAAAKVRLMSPESMLDRLRSTLDMLTTSAPNIPERQRSLRAAMAWSYDLLDEPARRLLERLSVFAGGCDLVSAQAVCDPERDIASDMLDAIGVLVDDSLIRRLAANGESRFALLQTVREFAASQLEIRPEADAIRQKHAEHFAQFVEAREDQLELIRPEVLAAIELEHDNLRAGIRWALDHGHPRIAMRIVGATWRWWQRRSLLAEGRWWCEAVVTHPSAQTPGAERAKALAALGSIAYWQGDLAATEAAYTESRDLSHAYGTPLEVARATFNLSFTTFANPNSAETRRLVVEALNQFEELGSEPDAAFAIQTLGILDLLAGDFESGQARLRESLDRLPTDSVRRWDGEAALGWSYVLGGDLNEASRWINRAMDAALQNGEPLAAVGNLEALAFVESKRSGGLERAVRLHGTVLKQQDEQQGSAPIAAFVPPNTWEDARATIGDERFEQLIAEGRELTLEEAVELANARDSKDRG
jgi:predicted ATPase/class 3 adenylate cyclase